MRRETLFGILAILALFVCCADLYAQTGTEAWTRIGRGISSSNDGYITALAVSPNYELDKTLFIGIKNAGLWRSSDRGETWIQCAAVPCDSTVSGIALPRDYNYNLTGKPAFAVTDEGYFYRTADDFVSFTDSWDFDFPCTAVIAGGITGFDSMVYVGTAGGGAWKNSYGGAGTNWDFIGIDGVGEVCLSLTITNAGPQTLWGVFWNPTAGGRIFSYSGTGESWYNYTPTDLVSQVVLYIRASWVNSSNMWVGTAEHGMWRSVDYGANWTAACDGSSTGGVEYAVRAITESPASATTNEIWEGTDSGMRASTNLGASCSDGVPRSGVTCIAFAPGFDTGGNYCEAFAGTSSGLYRIQCAGTAIPENKTPVAVDGSSVALAHDGKGFFMGSRTGGLFKAVPGRTNMVQYNNFPNGLTPSIVGVCLHPNYDEEETACGDPNTLFVAANFPDSPVDNGVYKSINAGSSWTKLTGGQWPSEEVYLRDLAISPSYAGSPPGPNGSADESLYAATNLWLYRYRPSTGWIRLGYDQGIQDIAWVELTPTFNGNPDYTCTNNSQSGYPCKMIWIGTSFGDTAVRLWYSMNGGGTFTKIDLPTFCAALPARCPTDVTGITFPSDFGLDDGNPSHKVFISSSSKGVLRNTAYEWGATWTLANGTTGTLPAPLNVVSITSDPDWVNGDGIDANAILLCSVASATTPSLAGTYRGQYASGAVEWNQVIPGNGLSAGFETRWNSYSHTEAMAGLGTQGAFYSDDTGSTFDGFTGYQSLPDDVFSTVAHERDPNYVFSSSPSMGVFVSSDKGESFRPWNAGAGGTAGPCRLTNGYGITMQAHRRGTNLDAIWVGTRDGIKARYTHTHTDGTIDLNYEEDTTTPPPSLWKHSYLTGLSTPTSGYWERLEVVPGSGTTYPVWAVSPYRNGYSGDEQGFANLQAGTHDGWTIQTAGLASTNSKGVRTGYDGANSTQVITSGQIIKGSIKQGAWDYYRINALDTNSDLSVTMDDLDDGGSQNPDLYVRFAASPTESLYDYRPYVNGDESVCVKRAYKETFDKTWGQYGDNPPTGWTITTNESPITWNADNWFRSSISTYSPRVNGNAARGTMDEWLITPPFNIPASTENGIEVRVNHLFYKPYGATTTHGYFLIWSDQYPEWNILDDHTAHSALAVNKSVAIPGIYKGNTNVKIAFEYVDSSPQSTRYWIINSVQVGGLLTGYWYIGVRGNSSLANEYSLTASLNTGCSQTFAYYGEPNKDSDTGVRFSAPDPRAPVAGTTWGTLPAAGVHRGTGTTSVNWSPTASQPINTNTQTVIQLSDLTLITGCDASGSSDKGIFYSPAPDEGATTWNEVHSVAGGESSSKNYVDLLEASNGDVLIACDDSETETGGVWLSGDKGKNWMNISSGFDSSSQALSDIVADNGDPVSYYASTAGTGEESAEVPTGLYTRTVTTSPYPDVTGITPTSGPDSGGTSVTITGTGFSNSCPTGNNANCPSTYPVVIFGDNNGTSAYEVAGTWVSATSITCTSPAHEAGLVSVKVRNPDTRESAAGMGFTFNLTCQTPSGMANNTGLDDDPCGDTGVVINWSAPSDWGDGGSGTRTFDVLRDEVVIAGGISEGILSHDDTTGTNGVSYIYKVRANNGCDLSCTTAGVTITDSIPSVPSWTFNNTASDLSACSDSGVRVQWNGPSSWGDGGSGTRTYDILRDGSAIATGLSSSTSSYTDTTGVNGTTYAYKVRANNGCSLSAETTGATGVDNVGSAPSGMANNTAADVDACADSGVKVDWNDPSDWGDNGSGTRSFVVYRGASAIQTLSSSVHTYTDTAGTNGVSYLYRVRAVNGCSLLTLTSGADASDTVGASPSGFSNNTSADIDACADSGVKIDWNAPSDWGDNGSGTRSFEVLRDGASIAAGLSSVTVTYTDTTGTNGASYTYTVKAVNGCSLSTLTTGASASDEIGPGEPSITNISDNDACTQSGIKITFDAGAGATSHDLYRDGSLVAEGYVSGSAYDPQDTASHNYRIRAFDGSCYAISEIVSGTDSNNGVPVPEAPVVSDIHVCATDGVAVTWDSVAGATGYDLRVDGAVTYSDVSSPYTFTPGDNASHNFNVRSKNSLCESVWSPATSGADFNDSPSAPLITSVTDNNPGLLDGVVITFTPGAPATTHYLYVDLTLVSTNFSSGSVYVPGDSGIHSYMIKTVNGDCSEDSLPVNGQDVAIALPPEIAPGDSMETAQTWSADKTTQSWPTATEADGYYLYRIRKSDLGNLQDATEEGCIRDLGAVSSYNCSSDDPSGLPNRIYYYLVTGYNAAGEGPSGEGTAFTRDLSSTNPCD